MDNPSPTRLCTSSHTPPWMQRIYCMDMPCSPSLVTVPKVPSTPDGTIPASQWQNATQAGTNAAIQDCSCSMCSRTRCATYQTTSGTIEYRDSSLPGPVVSTVHFTTYLSFDWYFLSKGISRPICKSECRRRPPNWHCCYYGLFNASVVYHSASPGVFGVPRSFVSWA